MKQTILITGASSGIGLLIANKLHNEGHTVIGTSRNPKAHASKFPFPLVELDLNEDQSIESFGKRLFSEIPKLDVLINNAGYLVSGLAEETSIGLGKKQFETNFWGTIKLTNQFLPYFRKQRSGKIITVGSFLGLIGLPTVGYYSASKHALEGYFKALRFEVKDFNIDVCMVEPMNFKTSIGENSVRSDLKIDDYDLLRKQTDNFSKQQFENSPTPEPVVDMILKVVSDKNPKFNHPVGKGVSFILFMQQYVYKVFENSILKQVHKAF
ncbi:Short chain dehydrogenase [Leptospira biflexa serovar Patoc strain 'Patoc 1 (Ames)']|uniref:Putative short-chain dehydrogenase/reductase SDR n=1 Tax=Leptospira biflexa serovar Patoc (strain Patoc 1 / ATCC 23582 / Paris) TaxID=456481 RepID=B0SQJ4_LEPBP|nr:SDR family NAD(P)-dependent oxidoreductase [Leptospira biflexa]ABZ94005.1 Short chain dehydrogenase [Leptospira biflexa serovar Patoc strain 'Patoc 1 (Ames)']ABZ97652.1 Putative short-chain dehydrogenase/reductase SDR [Leptospira biflexa serovar Patoc strain 'Patoc 1 (Paris)']